MIRNRRVIALFLGSDNFFIFVTGSYMEKWLLPIYEKGKKVEANRKGKRWADASSG